MTASVHARGIVIAGALAALALALGFVTLAMNQTASQAAPPHVIIPLKDRHPSTGATKAVKKTVLTVKKKVAVKHLDANLVAALKAGLPRSVAEALAKHPVVVVELWSKRDPVGTLSAGEAEAGATLGGAGFVGVNVDTDGGAAGVLTTALGKLPDAPAALVYTRPAKLATTLQGFNDRTAVQQAVSSSTPDVTVVDAGADWVAKANAICSAAFAKEAAHGGAEKISYAQSSKIFNTMAKNLVALTPLAGAKATVNKANKLLAQSHALNAQAVGKHVGTKAAVPMLVHAQALSNQWSATYTQLGASACVGGA